MYCAGKITLPSLPTIPIFHLHMSFWQDVFARAQIEIQIAWRVALSLRVKNDSDDDEDPLLN